MRIAIYAGHTTRAGQEVLGEYDAECDDINIYEGQPDDLRAMAENKTKMLSAICAYSREVGRTILRILDRDAPTGQKECATCKGTGWMTSDAQEAPCPKCNPGGEWRKALRDKRTETKHCTNCAEGSDCSQYTTEPATIDDCFDCHVTEEQKAANMKRASDEDGTSGQDRKSYSDHQDRDSYVPSA